jgi:hypothetical protein
MRTNGIGMLAAGMVLGGIVCLAASRMEADGKAGTTAAAGDVASVVTSGSGNEHWVYVLDPKQKVLSVYRFDARKEKLKLTAARRYAADHQLSEYNNEGTTVADIERLIRQR